MTLNTEHPLYLNNDALQDLMMEQKILTKQYADAVNAVLGQPGNPNLSNRKFTLRWELEDTTAEVDKMKEDVAALICEVDRTRNRFAEPGSMGDTLNSALTALEDGNYDDAITTLSHVIEETTSPETVIAANRLSIAAIKATGLNRKKRRTVTALFEENLKLATQHSMEPAVVREYPEFLASSNNYEKAVEVVHELEMLNQTSIAGAADETTASLSEEEGDLYVKLGEPEEAEKAYLNAHLVYHQLMVEKGDEFYPDYLRSCKILGEVYENLVENYTQARSSLDEAIRGYEKLVREGKTEYEFDLASVYTDKALIYLKLGRPKDFSRADALYRKAIPILRRLGEKNLMACAPLLGDSLIKLSSLFARHEQPEDALPLLEEAVDTFKKLATAAPYLYDRKLTEAQLQFHVTSAMMKDESYREKSKDLAEVRKFYKQMAAYTGPEDAPAKRECLEQAMAVCERLTSRGVSDFNMGYIYSEYANELSGDDSLDCRKKGWDIYHNCFTGNREHALKYMTRELNTFLADLKKYNRLKEALPLLAEIEALCRRLNTSERGRLENLLNEVETLRRETYRELNMVE